MSNEAFFAPGAYDAESEQLRRRQMYAKALLDQSQADAPAGQMVSGHYVPTFNGLKSLGLALMGRYQADDAEKEMAALSETRRAETQNDLSKYADLLRGTPEKQVELSGPMPDGASMAPVMQPAVAGDPMKAAEYLKGSRDPSLQQFGMNQMMTQAAQQAQMQQQEALRKKYNEILATSGMTPQNALTLGIPQEYVKNFYEAPNIGRAKVTWQERNGNYVPVSEYGDTPQNMSPVPKTGDPIKDLLLGDGKGGFTPNAPLVAAKSRIARSGAANVSASVNMPDKKFYEGLGTSISGQIEKGFEQAQAAAQTLSNANQIASGIEKAFVGPMAGKRMSVAQLGQVLGIGGADDAEALLNTRNVIQGLARQELAAAGQMKGQGQITESERTILRKAEAGEISDFTKPELHLFVSAIRKTARSRIANHERNLNNLKADPQAGTILPYLQVDVPKDESLQPRKIVKTGTAKDGRKVVQYSDGTTDYAN
jgi:hypothetical protein